MWRESQPLLINPVCVPDERGVTLLFNLKNRIRKPEVIDMLELTSVLFVRTPAMDDDQATTTANPFEDPRLERTYAIVDGGLVPWNERPEGAIQGVAIESAWLDRTLMVRRAIAGNRVGEPHVRPALQAGVSDDQAPAIPARQRADQP